jgi:lysophospholipase L1-like esterase
VHAALAGKDALIPDRVHPNSEGMTAIATAVFQALTGKAPAK